MGGFNLPPGCSLSDIPGNRPEDIVAEAQYDAVVDALQPLTYPTANANKFEQAVENVIKLLDNAHSAGYQHASSDAAEAKFYNSLNERQWRIIHNALAVYQCNHRHSEQREEIQTIMDFVRDNHIKPDETNRPNDTTGTGDTPSQGDAPTESQTYSKTPPNP